LQIPEGLDELVRERLAVLPAPTQQALAAVAALSQPTLSLVAAAGADEAMIQPALDARILELEGERGAGLPLFKDLHAPLHLELVEATTYPTGVAIHVYRPRSIPADQPVDPDQPEQVG
jgi:hypothetical protein